MKLCKTITILVSLALLVLFGLAAFLSRHAGNWENSPGNWARAFNGQAKPPEVQVHRSFYWRSPHFTYEAAYFFELSAPEVFLQSWVNHQKLQKVSAVSATDSFSSMTPSWFVPDRMEAYELWLARDDPYPSFRLYQNRFTKRIFVCDSQ